MVSLPGAVLSWGKEELSFESSYVLARRGFELGYLVSPNWVRLRAGRKVFVPPLGQLPKNGNRLLDERRFSHT